MDLSRVKKIVECFRLDSAKLKELFVCDDIKLEQIFEGKDDLSVNMIYSLVKQTGITMGYFMDGVAENEKDQDVERYISNQAAEIKFSNDLQILKILLHENKIETDFYDVLKIFFIRQEYMNYDFRKTDLNQIRKYVNFNSVNGRILLGFNDYDLFEVISNRYELRENTFENSKTWDDLKNYLPSIIGIEETNIQSNHNYLKDTRFIFVANFTNKEDASNVLHNLLIGNLEWDIKAIKFLLEKGAYVRKVIGTNRSYEDTYPVFGPDVFATKLLQDYCDKHLKQD